MISDIILPRLIATEWIKVNIINTHIPHRDAGEKESRLKKKVRLCIQLMNERKRSATTGNIRKLYLPNNNEIG